MQKNYRVTLLFNANKVYDRQIIEGIGEYIQASQSNWDIYLEEDFTIHLDNFKQWQGDGVIADFDNPELESLLLDSQIPVVGVGGSYESDDAYPNIPYVATDNHALVKVAFQHLKEKGLENFAFYGIPSDPTQRWANEREEAFNNIIKQEGYAGSVYKGQEIKPEEWQYCMNRLADWIQMLPTPIGIIAVTDSRARHLLQACQHLNIMVPDKISIIGIDNEELARYLTRVSLSSVGQGCKEMGFQAAKMLHKQLELKDIDNNQTLNANTVAKKPTPRVIIPPHKIYARQSTDFHAIRDPYVIQAIHFIRNNACRGIKVDQVLSHVGLSRSNMDVRFKQECGHSIHHEIHQSKLRRALTLLTETAIPITEISELCGYPSLQYMYTVFKKDTELTPKEYRDKHKQN